MKRLFVLPLVALAMSPVFAANENEEIVEANNTEIATAASQAAPGVGLPKISGYLQTGWNYTNHATSSDKVVSTFQAKRLRLIMDGSAGENIDFRLQIEAFNGISGSTNGNGQKNLQVMDAFVTWKIVPEFKIRAGQFYTPLGYENYDISPATLETVDFSNICYRMACRNPYSYNVVDYGRDLGIMFIGDAFQAENGPYLHYDVALTNGSLPAKDDNNTSKDVYVSATVRPFAGSTSFMKYFNVKATYSFGSMTGSLNNPALPGNHELNRFVAGAWYNNPTGIDIRGEYGTMNGKNVKEQGAYGIVAYHAGKFLPLFRWDWYQNKVSGSYSTNSYNRLMLGCNYQLTKNTRLQVNWGHFLYGDKNAGRNHSDQVQIMGQFKF